MKKIIALLVVSCMVLMGVSAVAEPAKLSVRGTGVVNLDADTATVTLGVREVSTDVSTVQASVNEKIASVVEALKAMGIATTDIHTNSISIYPNYNYDDVVERISGYTAENMLSVVTGDIENVGAVIDAAFEAGANVFYDIGFSASDTVSENDQALTLAIEHAHEKAQVMAEAAGMKLGQVLSISEEEYGNVSNGALFAKSEAADEAAGTQVYASPLDVTATVIVEYALEQAE